MAEAAELDLIEISPNAEPPVCKILDMGKYRYEIQKKKSEAKKKQKVVELKEIKLSPNIDVHDYDVKMKNVRRFLLEGNKVKVTLRFKGREFSYVEQGAAVMQRVVKDLEEEAKVEFAPKLEGKQMIMILTAK